MSSSSTLMASFSFIINLLNFDAGSYWGLRDSAYDIRKKIDRALKSVMKNGPERYDETEIEGRLYDFLRCRDVWDSSPDAAAVRARRSVEALANRGQHAALHRRRLAASGVHSVASPRPRRQHQRMR